MNSAFHATDAALRKGLFYLAEAVQCYWPANFAVESGVTKAYLNSFAENNIALHMARSFAEQGFLSWAEVPWVREKEDNTHKRLDLLAYSQPFKTSVALEFKNSILTPYKVSDDLRRLVYLRERGIASEKHGFNGAIIANCERMFYGIVVILEATEFADWWHFPEQNDFKPAGRKVDYAIIGKALNVATVRRVVPLVEYCHPTHKEELQYRFRRGAYALYDEGGMAQLAEVLPPPTTA